MLKQRVNFAEEKYYRVSDEMIGNLLYSLNSCKANTG